MPVSQAQLLSLLKPPVSARANVAEVNKLREQGGRIQSIFQQFGIPATIAKIESGPTLTRFSVLPGDLNQKRPMNEVEAQAVRLLKEQGYGSVDKPITRDALNNAVARLQQYEPKRIPVRKMESLSVDIAMNLKSYGVRVVPQLTGSGYVGVEVPHTERRFVGLREIIESEVWRTDGGVIPIPFGKEAGGTPVVRDLTKMPHLLVAGATGTGKSVFLNALIVSILVTKSPKDVRLAVIDMKQVELTQYDKLAFSLGKAATTVPASLAMLDRLIVEMEQRYEIMRRAGARNIAEYRTKAAMYYIVVIVDELADLMEQAKKETQDRILRLIQMSRAVGIHLILATQRPSVNIITGVIKANIPVRLALTVASQIDSKVIIDNAGAEKLISLGDALLATPGASTIRVQTPLVSDDEIERVIQCLS